MDFPQTGRQPRPLNEAEIRAALRKRHPQDDVDFFATDQNPEIRTLGRLALRRSDIDDLFALGDMCVRCSFTPDKRLLILYVGKALYAYQKAARSADKPADRDQAERAVDNLIAWTAAVAHEYASRRNIATALWAIAEKEADTLNPHLEHIVHNLLALYQQEAPTAPSVVAGDQLTMAAEDMDDLGEPFTIAGHESRFQTEDQDLTVEDYSPDNLLSPDSDYSYPSETRVEHGILESLTSVERDASKVNRQLNLASSAVGHSEGDEFRIGDRIQDRYEVADVRRGGMGVVYLCYDHQQHQPVAIKTFQSRFLENERAVARFTQEAVTWVLLEKHRHIVQARIVETINSRPHIILEHISGPEGLGADLRSWIDHQRLDLKQSIEFGLHIALGMQHACRKVPGLVHRDLKPANVLVTHDGVAKITDFGLVRSLELADVPLPGNDGENVSSSQRADTGNRLTRFGAIVGTAPYMSPEQCESRDVDIRSDIYAFGCMLYEMLTGRHVFQVKKFSAWRQAHVHEKPVFESFYVERLPVRVQELVLHCLEKDPRRRPENWGVVVDELAALYEVITGEKPILEVTGPMLKVHELIDKGYSLTELGRIDEALSAYDRAINLQTDNALAWARKGRALRLLSRYDDALECYNRALSIQPRYAFAWKGKGIVLERQGRQEEALVCYQTAAEINPTDVWNWYNQADVLQNMNRYTEALPLLEKALEVDPKHPNSWAKLGQVHRLMQNHALAAETYQRAIDLDPDYAWAYNGKGLALKALERHMDALACFRRAAQLQPDEVWHWYNLTEMLVELGQFADAVAPAQQATRTDPNHVYSWAKLGQVLRHLNRDIEALEAYDHAIRLQPTYSWAINGKGIVLEHLGRYEEALEAYRQATECADTQNYVWHCWYNQGNVLVLMKRYKEALTMLEQVIDHMPGHAPSWARRGNALRHLKRYEESLNALRQATSLDPNYAWAWSEQGITLEHMGRLEEALKSFRRASAAAPRDAFYLYQQADMLIQLNQPAPALDLLEQALRLDTSSARAWAKHGQVLRRLGRLDDALRSYTHAVELDPTYGWAWNGRGLTLSALGQHEEALACFRRATESEDQDVWYWYNQGDELVILGRFTEALEALDHAIKLNPRHVESWAKRGQALRRLNLNGEALAAYDQALSLNPHYAWAWNGRGLALENLGRREEALASYERSTQEDPRVIWYYTNRIDILLDMQRKQDALNVIERAIGYLPDNAVAWARKGQVLRRLNDYAGAVGAYQRALELDPTYAWAWNGQGLAFAALDRWEEAVEAYTQAVKYNAADLWFWHNLGEAYMALRCYDQAVEAFQQAAALEPNHELTQQKLQQARAKRDGEE